MIVYAVTDHAGHWPVGTASVVVASDEDEARRLLDAELASRRLRGSADEPYTLQVVDVSTPRCIVLCDGDY